jgi:Ca2+-binding RTX toxin-like protein
MTETATINIPLVASATPAGFGEVNSKTPVYGVSGEQSFSGDDGDFQTLGHDASIALANGSYVLDFNATNVSGTTGLFSKDANGYGDGGHLTAYIENGQLRVRLQTEEKSFYVKLEENGIDVNTNYHLAVSFGDDGLKVYLNGELKGAEPTAKAGTEANGEDLVLGAMGIYRTGSRGPDHELSGTISDFAIYDEPLSTLDVVVLSGNEMALYEYALEDLMPAFAQHHASTDLLNDLADKYDLSHDDSMVMVMKDIVEGTVDEDAMIGDAEADFFNGGMAADTLNGAGGDDIMQGDYGNDDLIGGDGDDVLDGGHGEDLLNGGAGDDLLISRADAREPDVTFNPLRDESDPYNELDPATGKLYADQPIDGDDMLTGGDGADTFYFQTLINAKQRYIEKHTNDDGTIRWHGVAGENDKIHDHWVDTIGNDTITDFDRSEGDQIVVEGHTTNILNITQQDSDGDGIADYSLISLYSDQGNNGGAHNNDLLGTISVYGDLVRDSDVISDNAPAYGIVKSIDDIGKAITPLDLGSDRGFSPPIVDDVPVQALEINGKTAIFGVPGEQDFSGEDGDYLDFSNTSELMMENGTFAMSFNADNVSGETALFSKDARDYDDGGHIQAYIKDGILHVRMQSEGCSKYLALKEDPINVGEDYHLAVSFGEDGLKLYLNGELKAAEPTFTQSLEDNYAAIVVGATGSHRDGERNDATHEFDGTITDFVIFDSTLSPLDIAITSGKVDALYALDLEEFMPAFTQLHSASDTLQDIASEFGYGHDDMNMAVKDIVKGTDSDDVINGDGGADFINGGMGADTLNAGAGNDEMQGYYGNDDLNGGEGNDLLDGGHGEDRLDGGAGDDVLISRADAREPNVSFDPTRDESDPLNELDPATDKLYGDQTIPGDDVMTGGDGADTFYFQTLINAKQRYIEKHTNDDGTIRWHGVAGENNKIHDHWVDTIGNDTITDFDRSEGDQIVVEGHTTEIYDVKHGDADGDGIIDHSVIRLYSDQGNNGGAHNDDLLGSITVFGDLITENDIVHTSKPAYGIVKTIDQLDEAITPLDMGTERDFGSVFESTVPAGFGFVNGNTPVFGVNGELEFSGDRGDYLNLGTSSDLQVDGGTYVMEFNADEVDGVHALFSKDAKDFADGGHLQAYIYNGILKVRMQSEDSERWLYLRDLPIEANENYHLAVSFGSEGLKVFLDGGLVMHDAEFVQSMIDNVEDVIVGATGQSRGNQGDEAHYQFDGTITNFTVYDEQLTVDDVHDLSSIVTKVTPVVDTGTGGNSGGSTGGNTGGNTGGTTTPPTPTTPEPTTVNETTEVIGGTQTTVGTIGSNAEDVIVGGIADDVIRGGDGADQLTGNAGNDWFNGNKGDDIIYGDEGEDVLRGGQNNDMLNAGTQNDFANGNMHNDTVYGGEGNDIIHGGKQNDLLFGDAGNDTIFGDLDNDIMTGGSGEDTFVFNINSGDDQITDFVIGTDTLELRGTTLNAGNVQGATTEVFGDTILTINAETSVTLMGVTGLSATDFTFM